MQTLVNINFDTWCRENNIFIGEINKQIFIIDEKRYFLKEYQDVVIDEDCCLNMTDEEIEYIKENADFIVFEFGKRFYYTKLEEWKDEFNDIKYKANFDDFKYIGQCIDEYSEMFKFIHLGVHSEYELLNGSHNSSLWCKKAKFLNHKSIGIVDKKTLAGTLSHQLSCQKEGIKSILGTTAVVAYDFKDGTDLQTTYECKLYAMNEVGWQNMLQINKFMNVDFNGYIPEEILIELSDGLIFVFSKESLLNKVKSVKDGIKHIKMIKNHFQFCFYQIDSVEFYDDQTDVKYLNSIKQYLNNFRDLLPPILINDSYYIDKEMFQLKEYLNKVDRKVYDYSENEYYKTVSESYEVLSKLFKDEDYFIELFYEMCENTLVVDELCNYNIETGNHKLPKYEFVSDKTNEELFMSIIEDGIEKKLLDKENIDDYITRIETEYKVIINSGFVDYFLILWDIVKWAKSQGIYVGPGRGSVGGCLLAYLMDIITVDPVENDLLFERFLNEARVSGERAKAADSMPDIDLDFEAEHRGTIKDYIRDRFGEFHTCSIGSYTRLKIKAGLKDFTRVAGMSFNKANYISSMIDDQLEYTWKDLIKYALKEKDLKQFMQENPDVVHLIKFSLNQCRSASIHASAVIIVPNKKDGQDVDIFNWLPIRQIEDRLVSEWEGKYTDRAGFLKEDILGLNQLDKFNRMIQLIKKNHGKKIILEKIPLTDRATYKLFHKGSTEDVFQFGSAGLKSYSTLVKPDTIEDLTAMSALYRPGPMSSNAHMDFALIKHGKKKPHFDYMLEEVTKNTNGLYVYQEQIMKAVVVLGGFSLVESDMLRTQIKKFDKVSMKKSEEQFINGAINNGCDDEEAKEIWNKLLAFSGYGFNKSHSFAYSVMTYHSQWMKANYPLEFWTTSLQFAKEEDIPKRISELRRLKQGIQVKPPSINNSHILFECTPDTMSIYWSLSKIKNVGKVAVTYIIEEREKNGMFGSYDDFLARVPKNKVNKRVITHLILAGAFDEVESIHKNTDRLPLLIYHLQKYGEELPEDFQDEDLVNKTYFWTLKQRDLTGFGNIDYKSYLRNLRAREAKKLAELYIDSEKFFELKDYTRACICGKIIHRVERKSKHGEFLVLGIVCNDDFLLINIWNDIYVENSEFLADCMGKIIAVSGKSKFDTWRHQNILNSTDETIILEL